MKFGGADTQFNVTIKKRKLCKLGYELVGCRSYLAKSIVSVCIISLHTVLLSSQMNHITQLDLNVEDAHG